MKNNAGLLVRICAFLVDIFIVSFVAALISMPFIDQDNSQKISNEVTEIVEKYSKHEISIKTYISELTPLVYQNDRANGITTLFMIVLSILYFIVYQFYTKQTIGKRIFKIKIDSNDKELTMNQMVIRGLVINSILISLVSFIFVIFANEDIYFMANMTLNGLNYLILLISSIMIIIRKDRRGLHDIICNTRVVKC